MNNHRITHQPRNIVLRGAHLSKRCLETISAAIEEGGLLLLPTDTGFCYAGKPDSHNVHKAFLRLRHAHPKHKPFSLLCPDIAGLSDIAVVTTPIYRVLKKILPGPFTCILEKNKKTPITATSQKGSTVGVRIPAAPHIDELLSFYGKPLLTTSVTDAEELESEDYYSLRNSGTARNSSPDAWWTQAQEIVARHGHELAVIIDPEEYVPMRTSTIFDLTQETPVMVRNGGWDLSELTFDFQTPDNPKNR